MCAAAQAIPIATAQICSNNPKQGCGGSPKLLRAGHRVLPQLIWHCPAVLKLYQFSFGSGFSPDLISVFQATTFELIRWNCWFSCGLKDNWGSLEPILNVNARDEGKKFLSVTLSPFHSVDVSGSLQSVHRPRNVIHTFSESYDQHYFSKQYFSKMYFRSVPGLRIF